MTEAEKLRHLCEQWMRRSAESGSAAERLLEAGLYRDGVSRSYYAMFHAVAGMLVLRNLGTSRHSSALRMFNREFVKSGLLPPEMSKSLRTAFEARLVADYDPDAGATAELARTMLDRARSFLAAVRSVLPGLLSDVAPPS